MCTDNVCFRPLEDALQFFSYFTNLEIQEDLISKAIALLEDLGEETMDLNAKDVCREVFEEMFRKIQILDLSLEHFMELIDISTKIYEGKDGQVGMFADIDLQYIYDLIIIVLTGKPRGALQQNSPVTPGHYESQGKAIIEN